MKTLLSLFCLVIYLAFAISANFVVDTDEHITDTLNAHKKLCSQIEVAKGRVGPNDALYKKWFGAYTAERATKVTEAYENMKTGLTDHTVTYEDAMASWPCVKCNAVAWTYRIYPPRPYTAVYFCGHYYNSNYPVYCDGDKYTKERILLHEWSHAMGYKTDKKYYSNWCQQLAKNDPDKAVANADSYSFHYCESY
uniref:Lysine-specific metallo-endopeptidase domain-containing protein n=1 Tax=Amphimedon queenslandica TaxID=400682 RepID=A0A1X7U372_AMPQE